MKMKCLVSCSRTQNCAPAIKSPTLYQANGAPLLSFIYHLSRLLQSSKSKSILRKGQIREIPVKNHLTICKQNLACLKCALSPGSENIKHFSCSTQLSMKFKLLINTEIAKINGNIRFKSPKPVIYPANKC